MKTRLSFWCLLGLGILALRAVENPQVLGLREQAALVDSWLQKRLALIVPEVMRREGIDMWLIVNREYNEDPVYMTMVPATTLSARRLSILLFFDRGPEGVERLVIGRYGIEPFYSALWNPSQVDQWECLAQAIAQRNPKKIGIDEADTFAFGDGLSAGLKKKLIAAIGPAYAPRLVSAERLAVGWLERRLDEEIEAYPRIVSIAHAIIGEVFGSGHITPGATRTDDLVWAFREKIRGLGLESWFHPSVEIQRAGKSEANGQKDPVIRPGDLLHCDLGLRYLRLHTDTQQMAYVLRESEREAPAGLKKAMAAGNRLQDILLAEFKTGRTGNEILLSALERAKAEGLNAAIYTHPLGFHGHAAGPTIGLWDKQHAIPGDGDYPLFSGTCYSIELNIKAGIPEWQNQEVRIALEEDAVFTGDRIFFLDGRQTALILID